MERRKFLSMASGTVAAVAAVAITDAPNVIAQPKVQWRLSTAYVPTLDVLNGAAEQLARLVEETSGGRFRIEVFPGGQIMQPFACFAKNAIALEKLRTKFKGKVEILPLSAQVLLELKKLATIVSREHSEKSPMARKVHASFTKFQALVGPWDHVAEGAYHQLVAG